MALAAILLLVNVNAILDTVALNVITVPMNIMDGLLVTVNFLNFSMYPTDCDKSPPRIIPALE